MKTSMKRFTETDKWKDPWFIELTPRQKLLWLWICDQCDAAGVIHPSWKLAHAQIGEEIDRADIATLAGRVVDLEGGRLWIPKFIQFQYGKLSKDCKPHAKVFLALEKYGISESEVEQNKLFSRPNPKTSVGYLGRLKEEEEEEEEDKDSVGGSMREPKLRPRNLVMDALAEVVGIPFSEINGNASMLAGCILQIKKCTPDVTPEEVRRRAENYKTHMPDCKLSAGALAKWWSTCHAPKSGSNRPASQEANDRLNAF